MEHSSGSDLLPPLSQIFIFLWALMLCVTMLSMYSNSGSAAVLLTLRLGIRMHRMLFFSVFPGLESAYLTMLRCYGLLFSLRPPASIEFSISAVIKRWRSGLVLMADCVCFLCERPRACIMALSTKACVFKLCGFLLKNKMMRYMQLDRVYVYIICICIYVQ